MSDSSGSDSQENIQFTKLDPKRPKPEPSPAHLAVSAPKRVSLGQARNPARLIIDRIELQNFKSYAHKQTIGPFHHSFSSVVGPNGSGKSNLIESLLFIFGYTASWMRLSKLNQLIHHSSSISDAQRAVVSVVFREITDNEDGTVNNVAGSEFSVRRSVNQQALSKYYINDRESTQGEVKELLMGKGIDLSHNRFLILQGEVEQIASMKQKSGDKDHPGLLEYLEDIIGSSQFIDLLQELGLKYNELEEQKHDRGERMKLTETELKGMSKGKDEAVRFVKRQKRIYQLHNVLLQVTRKRHEQALQLHQTRLKEAQVRKQKVVQEERQRLTKQAERQREFKATKMQIAECEKHGKRYESELDKLTEKDKYLLDECKFQTEDQVKYGKKVEQLNKDFLQIIKDSDEAGKKLPKKVEELKELVAELKELQEELDTLGPFEKPKEYGQMQAQLRRLDNIISGITEKREIYQHKLQKLEQVRDSGDKQTKQRQAAEQGIKELIYNYGEAFKNAVQVQQQELKVRKELASQESKLRADLQRIDQLFRQRQTEKQELGQRGTMFQQIMKKKIPGVLGRLGDLGTTAKEYDEVVSSSCFQLDNMVVETYEAGQAVINFLKESKLGKTTCIILEKISEFGNYMEKRFEAPKGSVRLFDLIKSESDKAKMAFYFSLRDTLYCQDGNLAKSIAYDPSCRRRVVTRAKNGNSMMIIEMNGIMSGCNVKRGLITGRGKGGRVDLDESDIRNAEADREKYQLQLKGVIERKRVTEEKLRELETDLRQLENEKRKNEAQLNQLYNDYDHINRDPAAMEKEIRQLEKELALIASQLNRQQKERQALHEKIDKINKDLAKKEGPKVLELRESIEKKTKQKKELERELNKMKTMVDATKEKVDKIEKEKAEMAKKEKMLGETIANLKIEIKKVEVEAEKCLSLVCAGKKKLDELKVKQRQFNQFTKEDQAQIAQSKAKVQAAKGEVDSEKAQCKQASEECDKLTTEMLAKRGQYNKIIASYDFLSDLQEIERMFSESKQQTDLSLLEQSMLNTSHDTTRTKNFPTELLYKYEPSKDLSEQELSQMESFEVQLKAEVSIEMERLARVEGSGLAIINEFREKYREYTEKLAIFDKVKQDLNEVKQQIDVLKEKRLTMFREGFQGIAIKLKEVYQLLTKGGDAELELIDSLDPFSEGVNFSVRPPKKTWKEINKLSGGQKTLSSLSLVFALHYYKPTPLYFMDEIDAALDYKNVSIVANYIKRRTRNAQFIIISLRNNMFELADKLVGVYKTFDQTKTISIVPELVLRRVQEAEHKENMLRVN